MMSFGFALYACYGSDTVVGLSVWTLMSVNSGKSFWINNLNNYFPSIFSVLSVTPNIHALFFLEAPPIFLSFLPIHVLLIYFQEIVVIFFPTHLLNFCYYTLFSECSFLKAPDFCFIGATSSISEDINRFLEISCSKNSSCFLQVAFPCLLVASASVCHVMSFSLVGLRSLLIFKSKKLKSCLEIMRMGWVCQLWMHCGMT